MKSVKEKNQVVKLKFIQKCFYFLLDKTKVLIT
jgi:hypothetical protein